MITVVLVSVRLPYCFDVFITLLARKGCVGFDNNWAYNNNTGSQSALSLWSTNSGIKLEVLTNQVAMQMYSCVGVNYANIPRKEDQGGPAIYPDNSCVAIEQEGIEDAINNPEFHDNEIYGPGRDYAWESKYIFSTLSG